MDARMRIAACLALASALAGCATYSERLAQEPWMTFTTPKPQRDFESCVLPKLRDRASQWYATPAGNSTVYSYTPGNDNVTLAAMTLTPSDAGTRVDVRSLHTRAGYRTMGELIRSCE